MKQIYFHIKDGKPTNPKVIRKAFEDLAEGSYELKITKKNKRSLNQNSYYWAAVIPLVHEGLRDMGNDVSLEETHEFLKAQFNSKELVNTSTGEIMKAPMSTTELSKEGFSIYIEKIQHFAAEYLNVYIPGPNEQTKIDLMFGFKPSHN